MDESKTPQEKAFYFVSESNQTLLNNLPVYKNLGYSRNMHVLLAMSSP